MYRPPQGGGLRRALCASWSLLLRTLRLTFVLLLMVVPLPVATLFLRIFLTPRRNIPTLVHRPVDRSGRERTPPAGPK